LKSDLTQADLPTPVAGRLVLARVVEPESGQQEPAEEAQLAEPSVADKPDWARAVVLEEPEEVPVAALPPLPDEPGLPVVPELAFQAAQFERAVPAGGSVALPLEPPHD